MDCRDRNQTHLVLKQKGFRKCSAAKALSTKKGWLQDSNPGPLSHEPTLITTRPLQRPCDQDEWRCLILMLRYQQPSWNAKGRQWCRARCRLPRRPKTAAPRRRWLHQWTLTSTTTTGSTLRRCRRDRQSRLSSENDSTWSLVTFQKLQKMLIIKLRLVKFNESDQLKKSRVFYIT